MDLEIRRVVDKGNLDKERIVIYAKGDAEIGEYILFDTTFKGDGTVSNKLRHTFWIPDQEVNAGDLIVIYTKKGMNKFKENENGSKTYFLYWGLNETVWNQNEDCAVLVKIDQWTFANT
jgi:hypothetical protein